MAKLVGGCESGDDLHLGTLHVHLRHHVVVGAEVLGEPSRDVAELTPLRGRHEVLVGHHRRADGARVVQLEACVAVPQAETMDDGAVVGQRVERRPAVRCGFEHVDSFEVPFPIDGDSERLARVATDVEEHSHGADATRGEYRLGRVTS